MITIHCKKNYNHQINFEGSSADEKICTFFLKLISIQLLKRIEFSNNTEFQLCNFLHNKYLFNFPIY